LPLTVTVTLNDCVVFTLDAPGVTVTVGAPIDEGIPTITVCHPSGLGVIVKVS
jgi:hypothetical protein